VLGPVPRQVRAGPPTCAGSQDVNRSLVVVLIGSGISFGTPVVFATVGEILAERSGVLNIGIEGIMLVGAVCGYWGAQATSSVWVGIAAGAAAGAVVALIF